MREVIIVGAGLSGLSAAWYLKKKGIEALVLEARQRCGGRIHTVAAPARATPVEMGATWFADKHTYLMDLIRELELAWFPQNQSGLGMLETDLSEAPQLFRMPETEPPSYRVAGGSSRLIEALVQRIGEKQIVSATEVSSISGYPDQVEVTSRQGTRFSCRHLVLTIPPLLAAQQISFYPALPRELAGIMATTHTWMGEAIKFGVEYEKPFWRQQGYSGTAFSHTGIIPEMYDHSNAAETRFALKGFLSGQAAMLSKAERIAAVTAQLTRLFGPEAAAYLSYTEKLWQQEPYTFAATDRFVMPHQHNGHPIYSQALMNGRLWLSGSETSPYFGGYMDGAVYSGLAAARYILSRINGS